MWPSEHASAEHQAAVTGAALSHTDAEQFWLVTATVLPVLALALIVEARFTANSDQWSETPAGVRRFQGSAWAIGLILSAITEIFAFNVLAGLNKSTYAWVQIATLAVTINVSVLLINPALGLMVRSNARLVGRVLLAALTLAVRAKTFRLYHPILRKLHRARRTEKELLALARDVEITQEKLNQIKQLDPEEAERIQEEINTQRAQLSDRSAKLDQYISTLTQLRDVLRELRKLTADERSKQLKTIENAFMRGDWTSKELDDLGRPETKVTKLRARLSDISKGIDQMIPEEPPDRRAQET